MLEIIAIIFLGREVKKIVESKGHNATRYILIMVGLWIGLEITASIIGAMFFGDTGMMYMFALLGAAVGGYFGYRIALAAPDIGSDADKFMNSDDILDADM